MRRRLTRRTLIQASASALLGLTGGSVGGDDTGDYERPTYFGQGAWNDTSQNAQLDQPGALQGLQFFKDLRDRYLVQPDAQ